MTWPVCAPLREASEEQLVKWAELPQGVAEEASLSDSGAHLALTGVGRVTRKPSMMGGLHIISGTRIPAYWVFDMFNTLGSVTAVRQQYPHLITDDILAAVSFALHNPELIDEDRNTHKEALDPSIDP